MKEKKFVQSLKMKRLREKLEKMIQNIRKREKATDRKWQAPPVRKEPFHKTDAAKCTLMQTEEFSKKRATSSFDTGKPYKRMHDFDLRADSIENGTNKNL